MTKILIIDDEQSIRDFLEMLFLKENYNVKTCSTAVEGIGLIDKEKFDLVFMDVQMPHMSGIEALIAFKKIDPTIEIIMITAYGSTELAVEAIKNGAYDFINKPFRVDALLNITKRALEKRVLIRENIQLKSQSGEKYSYCGMVGSSPTMLMLYELVKVVSQTTSNILVTGESGTGKELIARAIHGNGPLKNGPFIIVNCGAIPENLIESELFGHKRGSFTGAISDKEGLFETANKGTIFLDEVGELPVHLQVKLLRALQERTIRRVGDTEDINVEVRVIAATNQELHDRVKKGLFREDLFYRLNVIQVQAPPLRERGDDILMLAEHFVEKYSKKLKKQITGISRDALQALKKHNFPGNVRELENIMERAVALSTDNRIKRQDLPQNIFEFGPGIDRSINYPLDRVIEISDAGIDLEKTLDDIERDLLQKALEKSSGIKKRAAKLLGISFRSMRYRLEKLGLE